MRARSHHRPTPPPAAPLMHRTPAQHPGFSPSPGSPASPNIVIRIMTQEGRLRGCRWNKCLNHLLALARAHQEALMLDAFYSAATSAVDPDCRRALKARPARVLAGLPLGLRAGVAGCGRQEAGTG